LQQELRRIEGKLWIRGCIPEQSVTMVHTSRWKSGSTVEYSRIGTWDYGIRMEMDIRGQSGCKGVA